ncbi:MAG: PAS domain-containing protein [Quisquiliibacterium sp.]
MSRTRGPKTTRELRNQLSREVQARSELRAVADVRLFKLEEAVRRLRQSEARYKLLAENATDFVSLVDPQGTVLYASPSMGRLFNDGIARSGRLGDLVFSEDAESLRRFFGNLVEHGGSGSRECRLKSESGEIIWVEANARAITDDAGKVQSVLVTSRDISRRKRLKLAIIDSDTFASFLRYAPAAIAVLDNDMHYIAVTERWLDDFHLNERDVVGRSHYELFPTLPERWKKAQRSALAGNIERKDEDSFETADGRTEWLRWELVPWRRADGEIGGIIVFTELITERKKLLGQLLHAQKLEAVGQMIGGVAHDYNNLLGIVLGNLDYLADFLPDDEKVRRRLRSAIDAAERGADITRSLLSVAQRKRLELTREDLNQLLIDTMQLLRSTLGKQVKLRSYLAEGSLVVRVDSEGLANVLLNLALNAREALEDKQGAREVLLQTRVERISSSPLLSAGWYAVLEFSDNGCGMSEAVRVQAFEPFFSTKERGHGTGLGLSVVAGFAEQLGGTAQIKSELGVGSTISIYLPVEESEMLTQRRQESERLTALRQSGLLDSPSQAIFDDIVREAASICGVPMAFISLVDENRQWFMAATGSQLQETPRDVAFCAHAIHDAPNMLIVNDAREDARFSGNPLVTGEPFLRSYAGVPLIDSQAHALGTLCVLDTVPRQLTRSQLAELRRLAREVMALIAAHKKQLTRLSAMQPEESAGVQPEVAPVSLTGDAPDAVAAAPRPSVLVVDDEVPLCELASTWFRSLGFDAQCVHSATEALQLLESRSFDLLFTDVVMPGGVDGIELARRVKALYPQTRLLITSGYAESLSNGVGELPAPLIGKPYRKPQLANAVERLGFRTCGSAQSIL